jgi:chromosome segregation protein
MLFEGGKASLVKIIGQKKAKMDELEEDYDLEQDGAEEIGGIDIKVDMPRKKVKDIHLLSGGERALTSIALIFALVSCSPPPFLMLDEIDAPLDESNALRFGRILEELRAKTQFVVITHNRETMKQANILYGITMGDDGVSKVFSVKLDEVVETV